MQQPAPKTAYFQARKIFYSANVGDTCKIQITDKQPLDQIKRSWYRVLERHNKDKGKRFITHSNKICIHITRIV